MVSKPAQCVFLRRIWKMGKIWKIFFILFEIYLKTYASTHWVVTENGRIQSHLDSPFHLRRPYDLIALLDQETRRIDITTLYKDLVDRKNVIDQKWSGLEGASDLETRVYSQDPDCSRAGKLLSEIDLYSSIGSNGSSRTDVTLGILYENESTDYSAPDCTNYAELDYSMFAFEHLHAMVNRNAISIVPETDLEYLLPVSSIDTFGHYIGLSLSKNSSSWFHYNLGVLYWRILGDAPRAIECGRRALHYSPREYKDIPLLNLAGIFHQARYPKDAAILLHAAVEHAPFQATNYIALGNVYAVLSDYNRSVACYDNVLKLQPDLEDVATTKYATLCHKRLDSGLLQLHESLQGILSDLHNYHSQQQQWLRLQERLMWEQAPFEAQLIGYSSEKLSAILANRGQRCIQRTSENSKPTITCDFTDHQAVTNLQVDVTLNLQRLLRNVESETQKINEQMARNKRRPFLNPVKDESQKGAPNVQNNLGTPPLLHPTYPTTHFTSSDLYFDETGWPSRDECMNWNLPLGESDDLDIPVFLPPENKGFQVTKMLTSYIGLPTGTEHKLPWYPPICEHPDKDVEKLYLPSFLRQVASSNLKSHPLLQQHFLSYISDGKAEESEIGQRIITAMQKRTGPEWVLATLASFYWRLRSNTKNSLNCLDLAFQNVPKEYTDVVLVSIGSIYHQLGLTDDAIKFANLAFKVNYIEPSTNFLLALLHYTQSNPILAMYYMKNVLRVDPDYYGGKADELLRVWSCRLKMGSFEDVKSKTEKNLEGMCSEKDAFSGEGVICSANGEQCKTAAIQCFRSDSLHEDSTITLDLKPKLLTTQQCTKQKVGLGQSLISTLLAAEGSGGIEPDQSQLESLIDNPQQAFHMRISLGDEHTATGANTLGDFYVSVSLTDDPVPEAMLHVYDKSGTYPLSPRGCQNIRDADWLQFTSMWQSIAARNVDIGPYLKAIPDSIQEDLKPRCLESDSLLPSTLDHLIMTLLSKKLPNSPESALSEWLGLMAGDQESTVRDLGTKIEIALQENATSWILANAAALYWRIVGNTEEAVACLRQAITYVPTHMKDIPLINLANILHRVGYHSDALEVAYIALESHPNFVVNHFTIGNIHTSLGDLEKAIAFYRSSLMLDASFEPARNRLQAILCTLLFDESGSLRDGTDVSDN
ncbi:tetratricopeptide repeat protein 17-like isoform X2 [Photinus pyralis]|uniref:tetratricopeptide repeat protein 17-like isoform X2 n=1 Tax=Photinus pyralis TaxID=7054 RepID=UPI0012675F97|nr:tetratricopeptide repeat protein 17-like isoform X2 [Photinus pyralis]